MPSRTSDVYVFSFRQARLVRTVHERTTHPRKAGTTRFFLTREPGRRVSVTDGNAKSLITPHPLEDEGIRRRSENNVNAFESASKPNAGAYLRFTAKAIASLPQAAEFRMAGITSSGSSTKVHIAKCSGCMKCSSTAFSSICRSGS